MRVFPKINSVESERCPGLTKQAGRRKSMSHKYEKLRLGKRIDRDETFLN